MTTLSHHCLLWKERPLHCSSGGFFIICDLKASILFLRNSNLYYVWHLWGSYLCIFVNPQFFTNRIHGTSFGSWVVKNLPCRRQWHPTPVLLPGKSHGWRSLEGCSPWGRWGLYTTERLHFSLFTLMHWRRKWQPTPVFLPGESQGWGSLVGCHLWGCPEPDTTEMT